jgi:hypothetical protein
MTVSLADSAKDIHSTTSRRGAGYFVNGVL